MSLILDGIESFNYLVAGTRNRSEILLGRFTKYGDRGVDILPLGGLFKTEVKELAREVGFTEDINVRTLAKNMARPAR